VVLLCLTRPSENGVLSFAKRTLTTYDEDRCGTETSGTLDEVFLKINGRIHYLWRAVDQEGDVLDIVVQSKRDKQAAKKFFRKLLTGLRYVPRVIITDKLRSYNAAKAEVLSSVEHHQQKIGTTARRIHISQQDCESA
jgi:transposase-like protein